MFGEIAAKGGSMEKDLMGKMLAPLVVLGVVLAGFMSFFIVSPGEVP